MHVAEYCTLASLCTLYWCVSHDDDDDDNDNKQCDFPKLRPWYAL